MRTLVACLAAVAWLAVPKAVRAADAPTQALSLQPLAFLQDGAYAQVEALFRSRPRLSIAAGFGGRSGASGDYSSFTFSNGLELRWWPTGRTPWTSFAQRTLVGVFLGFRVDETWTHVRDDVRGRGLGGAFALAESFTSGFRFAFWDRLEVTPTFGAGVSTEFDTRGRLQPWTRFQIHAGLTVGYLF